ncbi:PGF-CTERM sorting domain-containing protein [Natrialbaceae archaeon AArc-T1-2]|uniref:PGF-CTERM sorting domain-containing protein n=1 Tax=Natrialbaceae archaeon AArc-T1-2 TaxID=3053904 RepID=UPI00255AA108|nr:PGF-CTERM sorting domain-containing protein [Natrialbaceae archaeon AArc-T1-2]WIV67817.1 PGF-CTERM sorting domain-containing protein [Natrialbaceae archaeon AArc-T1-2]
MRQTTRIGAVLVALLLVTSTGAAAFGATTASTGELTDDDIADKVYVDDDGSAVLVYEDEYDGDDDDVDELAGEFGLETETGLMHLFYDGEFEDDADDVDAELEAAMNPEEISVWGELVADAPEELEEFDVDIQSEQTETTSASNIDATVAAEADDPAAFSLDADADLEATASTFTTSGTVDVTTETTPGPDEHFEMTLTETAGSYELDVSQREAVHEFERDAWETPADAEATIESQYAMLAMSLGGTADVTLDDHAFEDDSGIVDVEYTVTLDGVKDQLSVMLAEQLAADQELDLDQNEAQAIADRITELHVDRVHVAAEMTDGELEYAEWDVEIDNYDEFVLGFVEIAESVDDVDDDLADQYDEVGDMLEAMDDADAAYTASMDLSADADGDLVTAEFGGETETKNYEQYVDELEQRELTEYVAETTFEFTAGLVGDEVEADLDYEATGEDLLDNTIEEMIDAATMGEDGDDEFVEALENFQDAEFEAAKMSLDADEDAFEFESAAAFEDLEAFESFPLETDDDLTVTAIHGVTDDDTTTAYVTVEEFVEADASEDDVRDHDRVDAETTIYMPGEGDREFPSIDEDHVRSFLDIPADDAEEEDGMPGFGGLAAVVALAAALIALRRQ